MRFAKLTLEPPKVRITQEEILADLKYPAAKDKKSPRQKRS
jgi:hypothetical protein